VPIALGAAAPVLDAAVLDAVLALDAAVLALDAAVPALGVAPLDTAVVAPLDTAAAHLVLGAALLDTAAAHLVLDVVLDVAQAAAPPQ